MTNQVPDDQRQLAISIMTTEQFTLQTARGVSTSESTSRATLFLSTLSSALVALGFVAQISRFGQSFSVFALLILPPIAFLGLITFQRAVQSGMEDEFYSQGMARIRQLYIELVPAIGPYFVQPTSMTIGSAVPVRPNHSSWQTFLTVGAAIGVVNSVVVGAIAGLAVNLIAVPPVGVSVGIGIAVTLGSVMLHYGYQLRTWPRVDEMLMTDSSARDPGTPVQGSADPAMDRPMSWHNPSHDTTTSPATGPPANEPSHRPRQPGRPSRRTGQPPHHPPSAGR